MSTISKLKKGRDNLRFKAVERANTLRYFLQYNNRIKKERDQYKKELIDIKKQLENNSKQSMSTIFSINSLHNFAVICGCPNQFSRVSVGFKSDRPSFGFESKCLVPKQ